MATTIHPVHEEDRTHLQDLLLAAYLDGQCYELAIALSEDLNWPLIGLKQGTVIRHAVVAADGGRYWDARGYISRATLITTFGPGDLVPITKRDLQETRPVFEDSIRVARTIAERLWPELPWKEPYRDRIARFADALEALSREHGLWIAGAAPGMRPLISESTGDEKGYGLFPNLVNQGFLLDRTF